VTGVTFAITQFFTSNFIGPELPDITSALVSLISLAVFLKFWKPKRIFRFPGQEITIKGENHSMGTVFKAWSPFVILTIFVTIWSLKPFKHCLPRAQRWPGASSTCRCRCSTSW